MGIRTVRFSTALAFCLALLSIPASAQDGWQDYVSAADIDRLEQLPQIREAALADAEQGRGHGDARMVARVMRPEGHAINANDLVGHWRCRQIKLGRMESYVVYERWFDCNIRALGNGLALEKTGGSQRFAGRLFPDNGAWVYVGASRVRGEPRRHYSGASPGLGTAVTPDDQVGLLTGIGDNHLRLEIPAVQESLLDVVEFTR
jgi:Domain of unknown function (DUF4893)